VTGTAGGALDAAAVRAWATATLHDMAAARDQIDALNVYPVPDGDTGTNLYLTLESALEAMTALGEDAAPGELLAALARGALHGARGNSGVILSQVLRGVAVALSGGAADAAAVADALRQGSAAAYRAVAEPVEGTMLTVLRVAAEAAGDGRSVPAVAAAAAAAAREALARTPDQLEVLRRAGVVDAGGLGVCVLLHSLDGVLSGATARAAMPAGGSEAHRLAPVGAADDVPADEPAYEVMFLLDTTAAAVDTLRTALNALGSSVTIAGDGRTWNVHAHVHDVDAALSAATAAGQPHEVRITSLRETLSCGTETGGG